MNRNISMDEFVTENVKFVIFYNHKKEFKGSKFT